MVLAQYRSGHSHLLSAFLCIFTPPPLVAAWVRRTTSYMPHIFRLLIARMPALHCILHFFPHSLLFGACLSSSATPACRACPACVFYLPPRAALLPRSHTSYTRAATYLFPAYCLPPSSLGVLCPTPRRCLFCLYSAAACLRRVIPLCRILARRSYLAIHMAGRILTPRHHPRKLPSRAAWRKRRAVLVSYTSLRVCTVLPPRACILHRIMLRSMLLAPVPHIVARITLSHACSAHAPVWLPRRRCWLAFCISAYNKHSFYRTPAIHPLSRAAALFL